jgi:hypothetical protein
MSNDRYLREKVRGMMAAGELPNRAPEHIWGGPGSGARCAICDAALERDGVELEIQFIGDNGPGPGTHRVHVACFSIFEFERQELSGLPEGPRRGHNPRRGSGAASGRGQA